MKVKIYWDERYPTLWMSDDINDYGDLIYDLPEQDYKDWLAACETIERVEHTVSELEKRKREEDKLVAWQKAQYKRATSDTF